MKLEIKIPSGWYKLRVGAKIKAEDMFGDRFALVWRQCYHCAGCLVGPSNIVIRRTRKPAKKGKQNHIGEPNEMVPATKGTP